MTDIGCDDSLTDGADQKLLPIALIWSKSDKKCVASGDPNFG